ncbi:hypothetical protein Trydic_g7387 [Trypoxylus dichotomus]
MDSINLRTEPGNSEKRHPNNPEMALSTQTGDSSGNLPLRKKKPSGAERRKRKAAREAAMAQPGIKAIREARTAKPGISQKQHKAVREASKAKPSTSQKQEKATREDPDAQPGTSHSKATGVKRNLSDGSTPKVAVKRPKTNIETGKSYSGALTDIRMAIVPENYPESSISQEQAKLIRNCILQELDKLNVVGPEPKFSAVRHRAGMLRAACVDAGTCSWLAGVVRKCASWDGAKLKLIREDDLPKPIKALVWIPGPQMESDQILHRLKVQP